MPANRAMLAYLAGVRQRRKARLGFRVSNSNILHALDEFRLCMRPILIVMLPLRQALHVFFYHLCARPIGSHLSRRLWHSVASCPRIFINACGLLIVIPNLWQSLCRRVNMRTRSKQAHMLCAPFLFLRSSSCLVHKRGGRCCRPTLFALPDTG